MKKGKNQMKSKRILQIVSIVILIVLGILSRGLYEKNDISTIESLEVIKKDGEYDQFAMEKSNYVIMLSNQSFRKPKMKITVLIDGVEIIEEKCKVENQHKGYYYYFNLEGNHEIKVESEDGLIETKIINFVSDELTWSSITYWNYEEEGPHLFHEVQDSPFLWM